MAYDIAVTILTGLASADLSTRQFQFVSFNSSGLLAVTADAAAADGVLLTNDANALNKRCGIATIAGQICRVLLGATVANGANLEVASGKAVTQSAGKIVAKALTAGVSGDIIPALLVFQR